MSKFILLVTLLSLSLASVQALTIPSSAESTDSCSIKQRLEEIQFKDDRKKETEKFVTEGKGVWVNIWNYPKDMTAFTNRLNKFKVDTVYLQINRSTTGVFSNQKGLDAILKAAHQNNIKIIGWSYCYLRNITSDVGKFVEPALYVSPDGEKLDGMAADIEENYSLATVKSYTDKIKSKLPKNYPLIAIVFSPEIKANYPWEYIANNWDVLMPMTYWHGLKARNDDRVYKFVKDSIVSLRKLTKKDDLKIHLITDGDRTHSKEVQISLKAAQELGVNAGVSIYPEHLASDEMLDVLKDFSCITCGT
jgi:hypothetical protein